MTNEEAIEKIKSTPLMRMPDEHGELREALEIAIEALEKVNKYRWHDLRKNPEDLPEMNKAVEAFDGDSIGIYCRTYAYSGQVDCWEWEDYCGDYREDYSIIAWRDIEPFEVEE